MLIWEWDQTEVSGQLALISSAGYGIHEDPPHYPVLLLLRDCMFSAAARVLTARRCRMSDETLNQHMYFCGHSLM